MILTVPRNAAKFGIALMLGVVLMLSGCTQTPRSTAELLENTRTACSEVHSYSTAYLMELNVTDAEGVSLQNTSQIYSDYDLTSGKSIQSYIQTISDGSYAENGFLINYYAPLQEGTRYTRYFSYDQATWYSQELEADQSVNGSFAFLEQFPQDLEFTAVTFEGNPVYELKVAGPLSELGALFSLFSDQSEEAASNALDAEFKLYIHRQTKLPYCATLTCTDSDNTFIESLGYPGGKLNAFSMSIYYDGYNDVPEIEIPAAALLYAVDMGVYVEEPLPISDDGRALLHATTAENSPIVSIPTPKQFTLDEGFSNLCNAVYNVIADAGTVSVHFTLEESTSAEREADILSEFDNAMALYAEESHYSEITCASEPMQIEIDGMTVRYDWLTYLYSYQNDSSLTGETVLYCAEYNYWIELEDGLLLRCYGSAQVTDENVGCPTPPVLAKQILTDITTIS